MSREAFEKLPEISEILERSVQWNDRFKIYHVKVSDDFDALCDVSYVTGAWMAWQEQQKQIDEYELVADSLDDLYQRERTKNKELQRRIEELERMHSEEKRILHNVIDIERNKNQRVEQ
ncbi:hypothetical protein LVY74_00395 [Acinetobacter sp. ME22]|uniref:hypothetical protein n=1 Tax=Acinetobacter sp. ME22 TaxID=2904802 RepID=UPI001EDADDAF|nr:hypothetical protein [Acinetobacter sp. ME22]MCG2572018.1 hypothetical protein [Acinetobacter sp. ME22]